VRVVARGTFIVQEGRLRSSRNLLRYITLPERLHMTKQIVVFLIKLLVSISLLGLLLWMTDLGKLLSLAGSISPTFFVWSLVLYLICQYLSSYRWQVLLVPLDVQVSLNRLFSLYLIGMFFNNFLPSSVGGDVVKGYGLYAHSRRGKETVTTVFLERYMGLVGLIAILVISAALGYPYFKDKMIVLLTAGITLAFVCLTALVANRHAESVAVEICRKVGLTKVQETVEGLYQTFSRYKAKTRLLSYAVVVSVAIQLLNIAVYYLLALALHLDISLGYFFLFFPLITIMSMAPFSINGLGVRETVTVYLFGKIGIDATAALTLSLTWFFMVTLISLSGAALFVALRNKGT